MRAYALYGLVQATTGDGYGQAEGPSREICQISTCRAAEPQLTVANICHLTGAALAMWQNHAALAALRGWSHAAQWQRHTRTTLLPCIARLQFRVRVLPRQSTSCIRAASPPAYEYVRMLTMGMGPSGSV